jgi:hypothetical protein
MRKSVPITSAAAKTRTKRNAAGKKADMSPTSESLKLPPTMTLAPRQPHPLTTEEWMVVRDREARVVARIDATRPDLLPS